MGQGMPYGALCGRMIEVIHVKECYLALFIFSVKYNPIVPINMYGHTDIVR